MVKGDRDQSQGLQWLGVQRTSFLKLTSVGYTPRKTKHILSFTWFCESIFTPPAQSSNLQVANFRQHSTEQQEFWALGGCKHKPLWRQAPSNHPHTIPKTTAVHRQRYKHSDDACDGASGKPLRTSLTTLSLIPSTHTMEESSNSHRLSSNISVWQAQTQTHRHTPTHTQM